MLIQNRLPVLRARQRHLITKPVGLLFLVVQYWGYHLLVDEGGPFLEQLVNLMVEKRKEEEEEEERGGG